MEGREITGKYYNFSEVSLLQSKIRERFYELGLKRRLVEESRGIVTKLNLEKHGLIQRAEKAERELTEANIHLNVAIKAAREAEAERSTARELLARQGAQLEAASKEREVLQQSNRSLQLSIDEIKHELEDAKSKMKSQSHFLELIKEKDTQNREMFDTLSREIAKLEKSQTKLKELCFTVTQVTKAVSSLLDHQKFQLSELQLEKNKLHEKVIQLTGHLEEANEEKYNSKQNEKKSDEFQEWQRMQQEMQSRLNENENEISQLQCSLTNALEVSAKLQSRDLEMSMKIRTLEDELKKTKESCDTSKEDKEVQTENTVKASAMEEELHQNKNIEPEP